MLKNKLCFLVNIDWFYKSHRESIVKKLSNKFDIEIVAGDSGLKIENCEKFEVKGRLPTIKGFLNLYKLIKKKPDETIFVVVSPIMIFCFHLFFSSKKIAYYNFSGLGVFRNLSLKTQKIFLWLFFSFKNSGKRILVVQNKDDYKMFNEIIGKQNKYYRLSLIPGSGFSNNNFKVKKNKRRNLTLGYVGRIRKDKGIINLINSTLELKKQGYNVDLLIWGKLDEKNRHGFSKKELDYINQNNSFFKGVQTDKNIIFSSFDIFCLPSSGEGLSKAAIEASSYGKPLILSNVPGNRDMIMNNGFLFEYDNVKSLSFIIKKIISQNNDSLYEMSTNSRKLFKEKWSLNKISNEWFNILD